MTFMRRTMRNLIVTIICLSLTFTCCISQENYHDIQGPFGESSYYDYDYPEAYNDSSPDDLNKDQSFLQKSNAFTDDYSTMYTNSDDDNDDVALNVTDAEDDMQLNDTVIDNVDETIGSDDYDTQNSTSDENTNDALFDQSETVHEDVTESNETEVDLNINATDTGNNSLDEEIDYPEEQLKNETHDSIVDEDTIDTNDIDVIDEEDYDQKDNETADEPFEDQNIETVEPSEEHNNETAEPSEDHNIETVEPSEDHSSETLDEDDSENDVDDGEQEEDIKTNSGTDDVDDTNVGYYGQEELDNTVSRPTDMIIGCRRSDYGCCDDDLHPAHGEGNYGCCARSPFGCCPDYMTSAFGPYFQGCDCDSSEFGCCPDRISPAKGPDFYGCGCQYTEFGCCEDQKTEAYGPGYEGCGCETYRNGCCPDGSTPAQGPNQEGCDPCSKFPYGCCDDQLTPALGQEKEGCGCEASTYGCCLDGSYATGPNHMGCLTIPGENCHQASERGSCTDYQEKWYYNMEYGGCDRFWYGGCEAGRNHFDSQVDCQKECVSPRGAGVCYLKKVVGPCQGKYMEWFYDITTRSCKQFAYGGCLGNGNRFQTKEACEDMCSPDTNTPVCKKPKAEGACAGDFRRWYFNRGSGECEEFSYSGCLGNNNRFMSKYECEHSCKHEALERQSDKVCNMYIEEGNCVDSANMTLARWGYSPYLRRCIPFYYTGCGGNVNNFESLQECEHICPTTFSPVITLPQGKEYLFERGNPEAIIPVVIKANPPATVKWMYKNTPVRSPEHTVLNHFSLQINSVSDYDAGKYTVIADNGVGEPKSEDVNVIVFPVFPTLSLGGGKSIFRPGSDVTIQCNIRGYPISDVTWKKKSYRKPEEDIKPDNVRVLVESHHESTIEIISKLVLRNVGEDDTATYSCNVNTDFSAPQRKEKSISVQYGPGERCVDSVTFAKFCPVVVANRQCGNTYYGRFCCRSCAEHGYLAGVKN